MSRPQSWHKGPQSGYSASFSEFRCTFTDRISHTYPEIVLGDFVRELTTALAEANSTAPPRSESFKNRRPKLLAEAALETFNSKQEEELTFDSFFQRIAGYIKGSMVFLYGFGHSEEIVGRALTEGGRRDKAALATKVGLEWVGGKVYRNSTRERIRQEIEDSLRRLRTDRIDLYRVHWPDPLVPIEHRAETLLELRRQGKILAIGVSNYSPEQMDTWRNVAPLHSTQPPYNIFEREIEADVLPYALEHKPLVLSYGAICRGLLSGKMQHNRKFGGDDLRLTDPKFQHPRFSQYLKAADRLVQHARQNHGKSLLAFAIRWILDRG